MPLPEAGAPNLGGIRLVEPLRATLDGEIWLGHEIATGAPHGVVLLARPALGDPGAIWRLKQEFAQLVPPQTVSGRPGDPPKVRLMVVDPPQLADDAVNLRQARPLHPGGTIGYRAPRRKTRTKEERRKERKIVIIVVSALGALVALFGVAYMALIFAMVVPTIRHIQAQTTARHAAITAQQLTDAVDQWAADNSVPDGTPYTWTDISDHVPYYIQSTAGVSGVPQDEFGRPYIFTTTGEEVTLHPDTQEILDNPTPKYFWEK